MALFQRYCTVGVHQAQAQSWTTLAPALATAFKVTARSGRAPEFNFRAHTEAIFLLALRLPEPLVTPQTRPQTRP